MRTIQIDTGLNSNTWQIYDLLETAGWPRRAPDGSHEGIVLELTNADHLIVNVTGTDSDIELAQRALAVYR